MMLVAYEIMFNISYAQKDKPEEAPHTSEGGVGLLK
jgi:hypothetical protein